MVSALVLILLYAQSQIDTPFGTVCGTVYDNYGFSVPGIIVYYTPGMNGWVVTDFDGYYEIDSVPPCSIHVHLMSDQYWSGGPHALIEITPDSVHVCDFGVPYPEHSDPLAHYPSEPTSALYRGPVGETEISWRDRTSGSDRLAISTTRRGFEEYRRVPLEEILYENPMCRYPFYAYFCESTHWAAVADQMQDLHERYCAVSPIPWESGRIGHIVYSIHTDSVGHVESISTLYNATGDTLLESVSLEMLEGLELDPPISDSGGKVFLYLHYSVTY